MPTRDPVRHPPNTPPPGRSPARILVTDGDTRACLALTRSLGRRERVLVAAPGPRSLAGSSRRAAGSVRLPDPLAAPGAFAEQVSRTAGEAGLDFVLPVTDAACRALLRDRPDLGPAQLLGPTWAAYEALSDKGRVAEAAARHGIAIPATRAALGLEQALAAAHSIGFPVFLKPVQSVDAGSDGALHKRGVERAGDEADLRRLLVDLDDVPLLVQEAVPGRGQGLSVLRWQGRTCAVFAHRRLREKPPGGGVSVLSESMPADPGLLEAVEGILAELDYAGLAMAEFKSDGARSWLMEFNARPWGSLQLAIDAGVDFPGLLLECARGAAPERPPAYAEGRRLRWWLGDLDHAIALARGVADPAGRSGARAALGVLLGRSGPGTRLELLRRDDPGPFVLALARWLRGMPD